MFIQKHEYNQYHTYLNGLWFDSITYPLNITPCTVIHFFSRIKLWHRTLKENSQEITTDHAPICIIWSIVPHIHHPKIYVLFAIIMKKIIFRFVTFNTVYKKKKDINSLLIGYVLPHHVTNPYDYCQEQLGYPRKHDQQQYHCTKETCNKATKNYL